MDIVVSGFKGLILISFQVKNEFVVGKFEIARKDLDWLVGLFVTDTSVIKMIGFQQMTYTVLGKFKSQKKFTQNHIFTRSK